MFVNLADSGRFWQIWENLAKYARFCQILPDYQCENEKNMFLSNMDPQTNMDNYNTNNYNIWGYKFSFRSATVPLRP